MRPAAVEIAEISSAKEWYLLCFLEVHEKEMKQYYLVPLLLHSVAYNLDVRRLLDCPSPKYLEPPKLPYGFMCGDMGFWPKKLLTLFICRDFFIFHGKFSFVDLFFELILGGMEADLSLSLCRDGMDHKVYGLGSSSEDALACTTIGAEILTAIGQIAFMSSITLCMYRSLCPTVLYLDGHSQPAIAMWLIFMYFIES